MQANGLSRSHANARNGKSHHRYNSSSDSSFGRIASMSRSESGTSETHYDERPRTPPTKILIEELSQKAYTNGSSTLNPSAKRRSNGRTSHDPVAIHLLVENALEESQNFNVLSVEELEQLKKERVSLSRRIESTKRKLGLELKVRDAAKTVGKLDAQGLQRQVVGFPPDAEHADYEETKRRCEQYAHDLWRLEQQDSELKNKYLQHTAAVLQVNHQMQSKNGQPRTNGFRGINTWDDDSDDEFPLSGGLGGGMDGIMEIPGSGSLDGRVLDRLQNFNSSVYDIINSQGMRASPQYPPPPPQGAGAEAEMAYLEEGLSTVRELHQELMRYLQEVQERELDESGNTRETNEAFGSLWDIVGASEDKHKQKKHDVREMGELAGHDIESDYSDDEEDDPSYSVPNFSSKVQRLARRADNLSDQQLSLYSQIDRMRQEEARNADDRARLQSSLEETQSHLRDAQNHLSQVEQDRSIESQRKESEDNLRAELEAKHAHVTSLEEVISEHQRELESTRAVHQSELESARAAHQSELESTRAAHQHELESTQAAHQSEVESTRAAHESELESKRAAHQESESALEVARSQLFAHEAARETDSAQIPLLETQLAELNAKMQSVEATAKEHETNALENSQLIETMEKEKSDLEADVIRLQTEVTIAKAELDGAYGSRAERAAESASKEVEAEAHRRQDAETRLESLQKELKEMVTEYEALVKQGVEVERDREALEGMNDSLREKLEAIEIKLSEEKVKHVGRGNNNASTVAPAGQGSTAETTNRPQESATIKIMREEFKKIMRDAKVEHHENMKAELTERRKLEALLRTMKKDQQGSSSNSASGATLSPVSKKSGLSQSVTAS